MTQKRDDVTWYMSILEGKLNERTGWGRNQIKAAMNEAYIAWLQAKLVDNLEK